MKNKVLYFPYINVPKSVWFTRMLLYWDEVGVIVPNDFIANPDRLDNYSRSLVQAKLVNQVMPGRFLHQIPNYIESFTNHLDSLGKDLQGRRDLFQDESTENRSSRIHFEKMEKLGSVFVEMGLANAKNYPWYDVERTTAQEFMAYLASTLGKLESLQYMPVTDELRNLENFVKSSSPDLMPENEIAPIRLQLLEDLFPAPSRPILAGELATFKENHGSKLSSFRNEVESELVVIASISDDALRLCKIEIFKDRAAESVEEIRSYLNDSGFRNLTMGKIGSVIAAVPGVSGLVGLAKAIYDAFNEPELIQLDKSFLYAAYAQEEILG